VTKLSCQEVLDQLWEYLDPAVQRDLKAQIDSHLGGCKHCTVEVDSIKKTISLYQCEEKHAPVQLSERLRDALQKAYEQKTSGA